MAKPRVFVSSTYYDLKHVRANLEAFINSFGYEPVLFENGDIPFSHDSPLDQSCYQEIQTCHMQVLIIGGSYGSATSDTNIKKKDLDQYTKFNSITKMEFKAAHDRNIPVYIFVENGVLAEYTTFKKNKGNETIKYAHVTSVNIFHLLDEIYSYPKNNLVHGFSSFDDISSWLKNQWAGLMAEYLSQKTQQVEIETLKNSVEILTSITANLKEYTEAILKKVEPERANEIKNDQDNKRIASNLKSLENSFLRKAVMDYGFNEGLKSLYEKLMSSNSGIEFLKSTLKPKAIDALNTSGIMPSVIGQFDNIKRSFTIQMLSNT